MLSKVGHRPVRLVCTNCGSPAQRLPEGPSLDPWLSGLLLLSMGGFFALLFFLTNPRQLETEQSRQRALLQPLPSCDLSRCTPTAPAPDRGRPT